MDFLKKGAEMLNKNNGSSSAQQHAQGGAAPAPGQGQAAGQKPLDFLAKKSGHSLSAGTNEKITDGVRNFYEKQTGKKVDPKWSN
ncbi:hypothetical protein JHW43_006119 [Diplocarpon mali]|nr:hypothetical protein JHW43_006119 [Diplocarpon mali]